MNLPPQVRARFLARAEAENRRAEIAALTGQLRAFYYPKQDAFYRPGGAKRKATRKTRRAGATAGGCRELVARALEVPGFRATIVHTTRIEARDRAWENDTQSGLVDVLRKYGRLLDQPGVTTYELAGIKVEVREQDLALQFSNGGEIELFGADDERAINKKRGGAKHVFWIDEAQDFRFLERFYKAVAVAALTDYQGECWVTGTPGRDCVGMFYEITRDDGKAIAGWEVHSLAVVDNPFFGDTAESRWERTAEAAMRENGWTPDDPDFQREWLARWVKEDARYVYAFNQVPEHELVYALPRVDLDGFPDAVTAMADLPGRSERKPREYFLAMGADLGTTGGFAFVVWAWSLLDECLYELCSWKKAGLDYDEMAAYLHAVRAQVHIGYVVGDAGGGGKPAVMGWSKKWADTYKIPIAEATKTNKNVAIATLNAGIRKRKIKFRADSPLVIEMKNHRWAKLRDSNGKLSEDKTPNHACDAGLYAHRDSFAYRGSVPALPTLPGSAEWLQREERELEEANCVPPQDVYGF